ncbi:MAG: HlyD family efflux transporter periplasmic adaptor subunit [Planctomycetota bacterium]
MVSDNAQKDATRAPVGGIGRDVSLEIARLAADAESGSMFVKQACGAVVKAFRSPYGAVSVRLGSTIVEDAWHTGSTDPRFWEKPVQELLNESLQTAQPIARQFSSKGARFRIGLVSVTLQDVGGGMIGVLSMVLRIDEEHQGSAQRELLEAVSVQIALGLAAIDGRSSAPADEAPSTELAKAAGYRSGVELAFALASSLRNKYGCDQVAIGFAQRKRVRVIAVSGLDEVSERAEAVRVIADAMGETMDRGKPTVCQRGGSGGYRVHKKWHDQSGGVPVATVPLDAGSGSTLLIALRRAGDMPFRSDDIDQVEATVAPYAPAFEMLERATRSVVSHSRHALRTQFAELAGPRKWTKKVVVALAVALVAWIAFGSLEYRVTTSAVVAPAERRQLAAPFAGRLAAVLVSPGDEVIAGQLLAELDRSPLVVEREQLAAEIQIARLNEDRAIAEGMAADAALARAERTRAIARLTEVDRRIERSEIRAPFDGRVVRGDLRGRVGESLPLGEPLFDVAMTGEWQVEIEVPQRAAGDVRPGLAGDFATNARPETAASFSLERVSAMPEIRGGASVYVAKATVVDPQPWFKPGMEGVARVGLGDRPVWWIASHRVVGYLRMNFWL